MSGNFISNAISLNYVIYNTNVRNKREIGNGHYGVLTDNFEMRDISLNSGQQVILQGIDNIFILSTPAPLQVNLNNGGFFQVNNLLIITSALSQAVVFNTSTAAISCKLFDA